MNISRALHHQLPHLTQSLFHSPTNNLTPLPKVRVSSSLSRLPLLNHLTPTLFSVSSSRFEAQLWEEKDGELGENLAKDGVVYRKTLRLVECSMFAAVSGLAYFLSNSLAVENYFGCFFALPIVISSMRWGVAAGRKTMVATGMLLLVLSGPVKALTYLNYFGCFFALPIVISSMRWGVAAGRKTMVATGMLLLVLSGPVKALTYLLMHGLLGLTMGTLWSLGTNWGLSVFLCAFVRAFGAVGYVLISSFLIRENILALITINIHTSLTFIITSLGINAIPSMNMIYTIFGTLLVLNCGFFVFLLHILYGIFFVKLGMKDSLHLPRWLETAI